MSADPYGATSMYPSGPPVGPDPYSITDPALIKPAAQSRRWGKIKCADGKRVPVQG